MLALAARRHPAVAVAAAMAAVPVVWAALRSWRVTAWVARARRRLPAVLCPTCGRPFGPAAGRARPLGLFDVVVACDHCGAAAAVALTPAGPAAGVTLPAVAEDGPQFYLRPAVDSPDHREGLPPCRPPTSPPS